MTEYNGVIKPLRSKLRTHLTRMVELKFNRTIIKMKS